MANNFYRFHKGFNLTPQTNIPTLPSNGDVYYDDTLNKLRSYENGRWINLDRDIISVKDFGAVGNGITNDTSAVQAAATALVSAGGGVLYFPRGVYLLTSTINCLVSNLEIKGDLAEINYTTNSICFNLGGLNSSSLSSNIIVDGLIGNATVIGGGSQQFIQVNYARNVIIRNCKISNFAATGIKFNEDCQYCWADHNEIDNIGIISLYCEGSSTNPNRYIWYTNNKITNFNYGLEAKQSKDVWIVNNEILTGQVGSVKYGIVVTRDYSTGAEITPERIYILGNVVKDAAYEGINITAGVNLFVCDNYIENSGNQAITVSGSQAEVSNNIILNCYSGLSCNYNSNVTGGSGGVSGTTFDTAKMSIHHNRVQGTLSSESFTFNQCNESEITQNTCTDTAYAGYAFHLTNCVNTKFEGNIVRGGSYTYAYRFETNCTNMTVRDNFADITVGVNAHTSIPAAYLGHRIESGFNQERFLARLQTSDAIPSILFTYTFPNQGSACTVKAVITTKTNSGASQVASYEILGSFYRAFAGAVQLGSTLKNILGETTASLDVDFVVSGNSVQIQVTGLGATNMVWEAEVQLVKREI